jgi:hypothetical protein
MNEQDQKRIHLQAWQAYQAALLSFVGHKQKIEDIRDVLASASTRLRTSVKYGLEADLSAYTYPSLDDMGREMEDFKAASDLPRRCRLAARELGLPVAVENRVS